MIELIQTLQSLAQSGLAYTKDPFDRQRFDTIQRLVAKLLQKQAGLAEAEAQAFVFEDQGYRTPKIDVRAAVFKKDSILLVRERSDGLWCLPGGWADINETPRQAVEREVLEETGLAAQAIKLAAVHDTNRRGPRQFYHTYKLLFLCEWTGGELRTTEETSGAAYFARHELPLLSEKRSTAAQIDLLFTYRDHPDRPTEFD